MKTKKKHTTEEGERNELGKGSGRRKGVDREGRWDVKGKKRRRREEEGNEEEGRNDEREGEREKRRVEDERRNDT